MPILTRGMATACGAVQKCSISDEIYLPWAIASYDLRPRGAAEIERPDFIGSRILKGPDDARKKRLAKTIENEIIPRLMLAHQADVSRTDAGQAGNGAVELDVQEFAELVMTQDAAICASYVAAVLDRGVTVETIYLDLLAPTARWLGELWNVDLCYFTDVAIGLTRLHQTMAAIGGLTGSKSAGRRGRRRALLVSMREEKHNFGLFMVASFFRRANWDVSGWPLMTTEELTALARAEPFHVIGISVSCSNQLDRAQAAIRLIRAESYNKAVKIMVGGPHFSDNPAAAAEIGADATSSDGFRAVEVANELLRASANSG